MQSRSFLSLLFLVVVFNSFADQNEGAVPNIDEINKHFDPGIGVVRFDDFNKFPPQFCQFVLDVAPQEIKDKIRLLKDPLCPSWIRPKKILLYGPSGSGKTTLAQVIAQEIDRPFVFISAGLLGNEYKNSVAQNLRRAIEPYASKKCVVIIDEIDCILKNSKNEKDLDLNTPKQIWEIIDLCAGFPNILLIGITNDVKGMDEPLQTRFAGDTIEVPLLQSNEIRKRTIEFHLQAFLSNVNDAYLNALAKKTKKFSHRELEKLVTEAMAISYLRKVGPPIVSQDDFEKAYKLMVKSKSLLNKINWADYEKHLQYGLQIAGLVVNVASLITNWRMSWLSYMLGKQGQVQAQNHFEKNQIQAQENADRSHEDFKKGQIQAQDHFEKGQALTREIADRNDARAVESQDLHKAGFVMQFYNKYAKIPIEELIKHVCSHNKCEKEFKNTEYGKGASKLYDDGFNVLKKIGLNVKND